MPKKLCLPHLRQCPQGHYHDDYARRDEPVFKPYEVVSLEDLMALRSDGYRQKMHPNDVARQVNAQIGEPGDVVRAHIRRRT